MRSPQSMEIQFPVESFRLDSGLLQIPVYLSGCVLGVRHEKQAEKRHGREVLPQYKLRLPIAIAGANRYVRQQPSPPGKMSYRRIATWDDALPGWGDIALHLRMRSYVGVPRVEALQDLLVGLARVTVFDHNERHDGQRLRG